MSLHFTDDTTRGIPFRSKETSWLSFNRRVLQEATDPNVPLLERIRFLGIFSSNLDEFFRVRVATLRRLTMLGNQWERLDMPDPATTLAEVTAILLEDTVTYNKAYAKGIADLRKEGILLVRDTQIPKESLPFIEEYFETQLRPLIVPVMMKRNKYLARLHDRSLYLAVQMSKKNGKGRAGHSLIEIPTEDTPRFVVLPKVGKDVVVMYVDDIIRWGLPQLFKPLPYDKFEAWAVKFTRDADIEFDDDFTESFFEKLSEGLQARNAGIPVRLNYDETIPDSFLRLILRALEIKGKEPLFPGARYHNRKDLIGFPSAGRDDLSWPRFAPAKVPKLQGRKAAKEGLFRQLRSGDVLVHTPYQPFTLLIDLLREAAMDPLVYRIRMTQYRLAEKSCVANALIKASQAGKEVHVLVEPTARFDEKANIAWANRFQRDGIRVTLGVPGLKVHAKLLQISRKEQGKTRHYSVLGTGNFNEDTARLYTDHFLFTADRDLGRDVAAVFKYFQKTYKPPKFKKLLCAPYRLRGELYQLIQNEIKNAKRGVPASITIKINNLSDPETVKQLYRASSKGVKVRLIVRSMFSLITELPESENVEAISIVGRFLEHTRILRFENGGEPLYFLSSADFLPRNFDGRIEVVFPIEDRSLQKELQQYLDFQFADSAKARVLDQGLTNDRRVPGPRRRNNVSSQQKIDDWLSGR